MRLGGEQSIGPATRRLKPLFSLKSLLVLRS